MLALAEGKEFEPTHLYAIKPAFISLDIKIAMT